MHYEVIGSDDHPTLMLMHGFMSSNTQWELNRERLSEHLRLVLVELMGHGRSPAPTNIEAYGRTAVLARLEAIRQEVGVERWWVGGHSLGGATSIRYTLAHPDRVHGVVFTNTRAAFGTSKASKEVVANVVEVGDDLRSLPFHPIGAKHFPEDLKARMVEIADAMSPHVILNVVSNRDGWSSVNDLHRLEVPVRLINGRYERAFQQYVPVAKEELPTIEVIDLDGGHSVNVEQPEGFNEAVLEFVLRERD